MSDRERETLEFREDSRQYIILTVVHIKYLAIFTTFFGMLATICTFGIGFAFFPWAKYDTTFDVLTFLGFSIFLISGLSTHWLVLHAIHFTRFRMVVPAIMYHCFLIALQSVLVLIAIGELVSDQTTAIEDEDVVARYILFINPVLIFIEGLMLAIFCRTRVYLRNRRRHMRNGHPPPVQVVSREAVVSFNNKVFTTPASNDISNASSIRNEISSEGKPQETPPANS